MTFTSHQLRDFSTLFSRSEVNRWLKGDFESIDVKLERYNLTEQNKGNTYLKFLRNTYHILENNYPNEYVLKNEFLNKWLKSELGTNNSVIFNEFRIGKAIADLAMFNGVSKAFEIKTILDKEYRLSNQLQQYKKIFNEVYIIIPNIHISKYSSFDNSVGIISFDSSSKKFELIKKAERKVDIDTNTLMEILHTKEYLEISKAYFGGLPKINAFNQFEICKELISNIPKNDLNKLFLNAMKKRNINNQFFNKVNNEFNQICLSLNLKKQERDNLINSLKINTI
ncbi:sce7726 family protein [Confluentibacter sediminis]|uniref:sce7726 family protein n=1 Tax=Confluentibacter sediminis TaxID=2219045 RepID=UPI000DADADA1|nr:sce7726 family protein [Confluentibacter sediminis]